MIHTYLLLNDIHTNKSTKRQISADVITSHDRFRSVAFDVSYIGLIIDVNQDIDSDDQSIPDTG